MYDLFNQDLKKSLSVPNSYNLNCPFCENVIGKADTKYHLNINYEKHVFRCPRCNTAGSLTRLGYEAPKPSYTLTQLKSKASKLSRNPSQRIDLDQLSWPLTHEKTPIAYKYITERGFTDEDIRTYSLRVGIPYYNEDLKYEVRKWSGRILFPYFNPTGECVYFVGRSYTDKEPRYLNSEGSKSNLLYNMNQVQGKCIICEGIISSITAQKITGIPAVALLGKTINPTQVSLLRSRCDSVYLSLDGDTQYRERMSIKAMLLKAGLKVWLIDLPVLEINGKKLKDPDDLKERYLGIFNQAKLVIL